MGVSVNAAPVSKMQFNQNGVPISGGKVFTYQAGTTTKLATYKDAAGNTQNTNPIILDSNGQCDIWLQAGQKYKFVLSPSTDTDPPTNPFWTEDNVSGVNDLSTSGGASGIGVQQGGTIQDRFNHTVINVKDAPYLAKGDGTADDTAAIKAAITALGSKGGELYFPGNGSVYLVSDELLISANAVRLRGDMVGNAQGSGTVIKTNSTTKNIITVSAANQAISGFAIEDIQLYGNKATGNTGHGLYVESYAGANVVADVVIRNVSTQNCAQDGICLDATNGFIFNVTEDNLKSTGNGGRGASYLGNVSQALHLKPYVEANGDNQIALIGPSDSQKTAEHTFIRPTVAQAPSGKTGIYLDIAASVSIYDIHTESNATSELILKSVKDFRMIGGSITQGTNSQGVIIGFDGSLPDKYIHIDVPGWVNSSANPRIDTTQYSGGSEYPPLSLGLHADGYFGPSDVKGYGSIYLPDAIFFEPRQTASKSISIMPYGGKVSGTWTVSRTSGVFLTQIQRASNPSGLTEYYSFEVPLGMLENFSRKGIKPTSVMMEYSVTGADAGDDVQMFIQQATAVADGNDITSPVNLAGAYDSAHNTAALRSNSAGGHQYNSMVYTLNSPAWFDSATDQTLVVIIGVTEANVSTNALSVTVKGLFLRYTEANF